jgi:hypothetical protein
VTVPFVPMAKNEHVARIVVGADFAHRSSVWRIYTHNDDVYVQNQSMRLDQRTSLHGGSLGLLVV